MNNSVKENKTEPYGMKDKENDYYKEAKDSSRHQRDVTTKWKWLCLLLGVISLALLVVLIVLSVKNDHLYSSRSRKLISDRHDQQHAPQDEHTNEISESSSLYSELDRDEVEAVLTFIKTNLPMVLVDFHEARLDSNIVHLIQAKVPEKYSVIKFLEEHGPKPERKATVVIFRGSASPPVVEEYVVGPLPDIQYARLVNTTSRDTTVPFTLRPLSKLEFKLVYKHLVSKIAKLAGHLLMESYEATPFNCGNRCLTASLAPVSGAFIPEGTRKTWHFFQYDVEYPSLNPVDFQFLVDVTSVYPENWKIEKVWYANQMFDSLEDLVRQYDEGTINKTRISFPTDTERESTSLNFRYPLVPEKSQRAPRQFEPDGPRYVVRGNEVMYLDWAFNFHVSPTDGIQLFNIRFDNERIVYELSMQEVIVMYSGNNPASRYMNYADGAGLFGTRFRGLVPGSDCPMHAQMVDTYLYSANDNGGRAFQNALCVFEHNTNLPLRRHRSYGMSGATYAALEAVVLVVRGIISFINYDYAFDYIFYQNGVIETKVSMTGFLGTTFYYPEEDPYGAHVNRNVSAGLHNHLFHFKVDIDVKGTRNRFETLDIKTERKQDPWNKGTYHTQAYIERNLKRTETEATCKYSFEKPKYLLFTQNGTKTDEGVSRSYRILVDKMSKQMVQENEGFERSVSWSRYQLAVTRYREGEERSSSIFTMWDSRKPVVNFQNYIDDNEDIVDKDLVAWVTVGTQHIPQKENVPNTATTGTQLSFLILPYNYFDEDPSMRSRDAIRITPLDKSRPLSGAHVEHYGAFRDSECSVSMTDMLQELRTNSSFIFS